MAKQTEIDFTKDYSLGRELRDKGIKKAVVGGDRILPNWKHEAYLFFLGYISSHPEFMMEECRKASEGIIPQPPSNRAWGSIIVQAKKEGIIQRVGFRSVVNPKAHMAPCSVWKVVNK